jgi:3',5'-cyclic AMP phosphodiesterase CpdA
MLVRCLVVTVSCLAFTSCQSAPPTQWESFFFIQMADTQLAFGDYARNIRNYERAIQHANRLEPDFVIICGDLVSDPFKEAETDEFLRITKTLDPGIPLKLVSGNHDVGNDPTPETMAWYRKRFGLDWYTFQHKDCFSIVLNSSLINSPAKVRNEYDTQYEFLLTALRDAREQKSKHIFVFQHHPWFLKSFDEKKGYFNVAPRVREKFFDLFIEHGVRAVFAGHYHRNSLASHQGIEMITTSAVGRQLGKDLSGFRVVQVFRDRIEHHYYDLDHVPAEVTPSVGRKTAER